MLWVEGVGKTYGHGAQARWLYRDLSFTLAPGEKIALVGRNGQGKSTLLKILGGVLLPSAGRVRWNMSSSWPLGFTGGFHGGMTGYDNIRFIARVYRRPAQWLIDRVDEFAELGSALAMPLRHYSSGMRARLAFGLSVAIEFECYLIDEVISVGDAAFRHKCHNELFVNRQDRAFVIATHDLGLLQEYCNRAIIIEAGRAKIFEDVSVAMEVYAAIVDDHEREKARGPSRRQDAAA
jgi:capsular polysaccharide transport system ATP-binding protein